MKRSPSAFRRIPPSPRTASVTSVPADSSGKTMPVGWNWTSSMSRSRQPASAASRIASPVFSSRRDDERRQMRVCPPAASTTASATISQPAAVVDVEAVRAEDAAVVHEQAGDVDVVAHLHAHRGGPLDERALDLAAGVVAGEAGAPVAVGAEEALREAPVVLTREPGAPADEVLDRARRLPAQELDARGIGEPVALAQRVGRVLLPAVLGIHRPERGVDASGGEHGVGVVAPALADAEHLDTALGELDRRAQAGRARADDEDARGRALLGRPGAHRPLASR